MVKKPTKKSVALAVSAALATSLAASPLTHANPPSDNSSLLNAATLAGGYMQFALNGEGKCGDRTAGAGQKHPARTRQHGLADRTRKFCRAK